MHVQLTSNNNLKRNVRRWRQETSTAPIPLNINFPVIPDKYYRTTCDTIFLRKDIGPTSDRILIFFQHFYDLCSFAWQNWSDL